MTDTPQLLLGLDLGGTSTKLILQRPSGERLAQAATTAYAQPGAGELAEAIVALLAEHTPQLNQPKTGGPVPHASVAVGCCVPGKFAADRETVEFAANLPALNGLHIPSFVRALLAVPPDNIRILPDAMATALGSWAAEPAPGRLLAIALGTGVGASLLVDGHPVTLAPGTAGHLGQIDVSLDDAAPLGPDGGRGSLEAYIGLPALRARFGETQAELIAGIADMSPADPALRALAKAIRMAHAIYTPGHVRLLGGLGLALAPQLETIKQLVNCELTAVANPDWTLTTGDDPYFAAAGAASAASSASFTGLGNG